MHIRDYQEWLVEWDAARGWEKTLPSHTLLHAMEELGEVSRIVQMIEGYREPSEPEPDALRSLLALELSDLQVMLFKIAYLCGVDMEQAMLRGMAKADARFPDPAAGPADVDAYWRRFAEFLTRAALAESLEAQTAQRDAPAEQ